MGRELRLILCSTSSLLPEWTVILKHLVIIKALFVETGLHGNCGLSDMDICCVMLWNRWFALMVSDQFL